MADDAEGSLKDTLEALESAKKLVGDLEYRVEQLSLGDYDTLKKVAEVLHQEECTYNHTDGCSWGYEMRSENPWFADAHQRWLETARYRVRAADMTSEEFLKALEVVYEAKRRARM